MCSQFIKWCIYWVWSKGFRIFRVCLWHCTLVAVLTNFLEQSKSILTFFRSHIGQTQHSSCICNKQIPISNRTSAAKSVFCCAKLYEQLDALMCYCLAKPKQYKNTIRTKLQHNQTQNHNNRTLSLRLNLTMRSNKEESQLRKVWYDGESRWGQAFCV